MLYVQILLNLTNWILYGNDALYQEAYTTCAIKYTQLIVTVDSNFM